MITLALIGLGQWGKHYLETVQQIPYCSIKYICAKSNKTLRTFPRTYIKLLHFQDLFQCNDLDGVIIATPVSTHYLIAKEFIVHRIPVLIEKPISGTYREALFLKRLVEQTKTIVMSGHIFLYNPAFQKFLQLSKNIGEIYHIIAKDCNFGPLRKDISALWDWAPHTISMCLEIAGRAPISVTAWEAGKRRKSTGFIDMAIVKLNFGQYSAFLEIGSLSPIKKRNITIVGTKGSVIFNDLVKQKIQYRINGEVSTKNNISNDDKVILRYPEYSLQMPLQNQLEEFISSIKRKKEPKTNINQGVIVIRIINCIEKSLKRDGATIVI